MEIRVYLEEADVSKDFFDCKENNLKCPFCQQELVGTIGHPICRNQNCVMCDDPMPQELLEELIRTRKALDVARHTIGWINQMIDEHTDKQAIKIKCEYALEQITALEQKDK